ncbi:oxaloacetate decarboxylase alpha chain [Neisseria sp. HMSC064F03]|uniref:oxaloacetate decarboxylase alpha chain n=1 Tax=Neisseria sp. HMSC064F03 TaxID=1715037 RepID=UPI0008A965BD|nr:oxaloacetate decarboxylase alpha chain [Neisseria sp. HMSC064F03]OHQ17981.1 oxaloacetate decarboxylase alpha chain [Neisseria sp. HMSC064F03]
MSKVKTEILGPTISDFLKYEATPLTRVAIAAPQGTKAGTFVSWRFRNEVKILALTDEADGKVIVQPHNCIINLDQCSDDEIRGAPSRSSSDVMEQLNKDGDPYGIVYVVNRAIKPTGDTL